MCVNGFFVCARVEYYCSFLWQFHLSKIVALCTLIMLFPSFWKKKKKKTFLSLHLPVCKKRTKLRAWPTFGDHALEVNDVGVVELAHDAGLGQEVPPLLVGVAGLQRLDGHADLPLAGHLQAAAAHLAELPWKKHTAGLKNVERWYTSTPILNCTGY